jgi:hypothetical protein
MIMLELDPYLSDNLDTSVNSLIENTPMLKPFLLTDPCRQNKNLIQSNCFHECPSHFLMIFLVVTV